MTPDQTAQALQSVMPAGLTYDQQGALFDSGGIATFMTERLADCGYELRYAGAATQVDDVNGHLLRVLEAARLIKQNHDVNAYVLDLIDDLLELHEHLRHAGALPKVWKAL